MVGWRWAEGYGAGKEGYWLLPRQLKLPDSTYVEFEQLKRGWHMREISTRLGQSGGIDIPTEYRRRLGIEPENDADEAFPLGNFS